MSRKFRGKLLAVSLLAFCAMSAVSLTSCGGTTPNPEPTPEPGPGPEPTPTPDPVLEGVTTFSITNKEELQKEWQAGNGNRMLEFSFGDKSVNAPTAVSDGAIEITSSDPSVITSSGLYLMSLKEGKATITVTVHTDTKDLTDSVEITVIAPMEASTAEEITVSKLLDLDYDAWSKERPQTLYSVTGIVGGWYNASNGNPSAYGNFYLQDSKDTSKEIIVYGATQTADALKFNSDGTYTFSNPQDFLNEDGSAPIKRGDTVTLTVILDSYNGVNQIQGIITDIQSAEVIDYTSLELSANKNTIKIGEALKLDVKSAPEKVNVGSYVYEVTDNDGVIDVKDGYVYARKAGTATITVKSPAEGSEVKSNSIVIRVSNEEIERETVSALYKHKAGDRVYFKAKYINTYGDSQNYGMYVGDGDSAVLLYQYESEENLEVNDTLSITGTVDIYNGLFQIADADVEVVSDDEKIVNPTTFALDTLTDLKGVSGKDAGRKVSVTGTVIFGEKDAKYDNYGNAVFSIKTDNGVTFSAKADTRYVDWKFFNSYSFLKANDRITLNANITFFVSKSTTVGATAEGLQLVNLSIEDGSEITYSSISELYAAKEPEYANFYGYYMGEFKAAQNYGIFVGDGERAIFVYGAKAPKNAVANETVVTVSGEVDYYNGVLQIARGSIVNVDTSQRTLAVPVTVDLNTLTAETLEKVDGATYGSRRAKVANGVISNKKVDEYGTITFDLTINRLYTIGVEADNRYVKGDELNKFNQLHNGDTVSLEGNISFDTGSGLATNESKMILVNPTITSDVEITYTSLAIALADAKVGSYINVYGSVTGDYGNNGFFVGDGDHAVYVYKTKLNANNVSDEEKIDIGDVVLVTGVLDAYNGTLEVTDAVVQLDPNAENRNIKEPTTLEINSSDSLAGVNGEDSGRKARVSGKVKEVEVDSKYGNTTVTVTLPGGQDVTVYLDSRDYTEEELTAFRSFGLGEDVVIEGFITFKNSDSKYDPNTDATGITLVVVNLVEDTETETTPAA